MRIAIGIALLLVGLFIGAWGDEEGGWSGAVALLIAVAMCIGGLYLLVGPEIWSSCHPSEPRGC
jgi:drug/metabolite transporter (DMT)-like permease